MTQPQSSWEPYQIHGEQRSTPVLITCDHARNRIPPQVCDGDLGLDPEDMARHIAYDVGAAGVTMALADALDAPAVLSNFSRLVIDPNRDPRDPTVMMRLYDGSVIPGNRDVTDAERDRRIANLHAPYHDAIARLAARHAGTVIIAIHSFTPQLRGRAARPWHVGVLHAPADGRLSRALLARLRGESDLCVGDNQPYTGHLPGDAIDRHALRHGRHNTLVELRNDLIAAQDQQGDWAARLAPMLRQAMQDVGALTG